MKPFLQKLLPVVLLLLSARSYAQTRDTYSVYFRTDQRTLTSQAKATIDTLIYEDLINDHSQFAIIGYADYVGSNGSNKQLSRDRARAVAAYISGYNIQKQNIILLEGRGEVERSGMNDNSGYQPDRRVDIVLHYKPPVVVIPPPPAPKPKKPAPPATVAPVKPKVITDVKVGETIVLKNIYFYPGRHEMKPESQPALEELKKVLVAHPTMRIKIEGHICCITNLPDAMDEDTGQLKLSENRAKYIYDWLVKHGIKANRLEWAGFGRRYPVIENEVTETDADQNRRVELRVLSQ